GGEVLGERAFSSLAEAPGEIDHAFIMTPGDSIERAIEECGARGVPVATIFSDGFADAGAEGAARQVRLVERARALGVRVLGPNSMGLVDVPGRVALSVNAVLEMDALPAGTTSFVSHSGTLLGTLRSRARTPVRSRARTPRSTPISAIAASCAWTSSRRWSRSHRLSPGVPRRISRALRASPW